MVFDGVILRLILISEPTTLVRLQCVISILVSFCSNALSGSEAIKFIYSLAVAACPLTLIT